MTYQTNNKIYRIAIQATTVIITIALIAMVSTAIWYFLGIVYA